MTRLPQAAFTAALGATVQRVGEGTCRLALTAGPQHLDRRGAVHVGVITALMDSTIGIALGDLRRSEVRRRPHATVAMSASFLADAHDGDEIIAEGRVIRAGPSIVFGEAAAHLPDGRTLALSRLTFAISARERPHPHDAPPERTEKLHPEPVGGRSAHRQRRLSPPKPKRSPHASAD